jgi:hypothetical protein
MQNWKTGARVILCGAAGCLNALELGLQGNGDPVPSGFLLGFILGLAWSASLLYGIPLMTRNSNPFLKNILSWVSFAIVIVLLLSMHWDLRHGYLPFHFHL